jgi:hypothetical protein
MNVVLRAPGALGQPACALSACEPRRAELEGIGPEAAATSYVFAIPTPPFRPPVLRVR